MIQKWGTFGKRMFAKPRILYAKQGIENHLFQIRFRAVNNKIT